MIVITDVFSNLIRAFSLAKAASLSAIRVRLNSLMFTLILNLMLLHSVLLPKTEKEKFCLLERKLSNLAINVNWLTSLNRL